MSASPRAKRRAGGPSTPMVEEYEEEAFFDGDDSLRVPAERLDAVIKLF